MKDRRSLAALGVALFALGFALGYWARGGGTAQEASLQAAIGAQGAAPEGSSPGEGGAEGASSDEGSAPSAGAGRRGGEGGAPGRGTGGVSVVGREGEGGGATPPRVTSGDPIERGSEDRPVLDGGIPRGTLDREAIRDVIRSHRDQLGFCFSWQLHSHPELRGRIVMDFTIGEDGSVTHAEVADDQLGDETVLTCFQGVTRRMRFPAPENGTVRVRYPFELASDEQQPEQPQPEQPQPERADP